MKMEHLPEKEKKKHWIRKFLYNQNSSLYDITIASFSIQCAHFTSEYMLNFLILKMVACWSFFRWFLEISDKIVVIFNYPGIYFRKLYVGRQKKKKNGLN